MSYDILAFSPEVVSDAEFPRWWDEQSEWSESHSYDDASVTTASLRAMYDELKVAYPPMNGPDAPTVEEIDSEPDLEVRLTDYSIGSNIIYAAFAWSQAEAARAAFVDLARKHGVAVAEVSGDGAIIRPPAIAAPKAPRKPFWRKK